VYAVHEFYGFRVRRWNSNFIGRRDREADERVGLDRLVWGGHRAGGCEVWRVHHLSG
jgi:hypothetical protein